MTSVERDLIAILEAYEGKEPLISCQGQAMDGYSALYNFLDLAKKVKGRYNMAKMKHGPTTKIPKTAEGGTKDEGGKGIGGFIDTIANKAVNQKLDSIPPKGGHTHAMAVRKVPKGVRL